MRQFPSGATISSIFFTYTTLYPMTLARLTVYAKNELASARANGAEACREYVILYTHLS